MRPLLIAGCSALVLGAAVLTAPNPGWAHSEEMTGRWGSGDDRLCSVLVDSKGDPVISSADDAVLTNFTFDCPEPQEVAVVAPAAPPAPLPDSGLVLFDFDKSELNTTGEATLEDVIFDIKDRELGGIVVAGHTDTAGPADYNMQLSQARANTVATELIKSGIPAQIVTTEAFGQTQLAVETPDETPEQSNRRVVIDFKR